MGLCVLLHYVDSRGAHPSGCVRKIVWYCMFQSECVSARYSHFTTLSGHCWSDFPKYYIMGLHWRSPLPMSPHTRTCVHARTHTHVELGVQRAGSRLQTHNTNPFSFCYTTLRPTHTTFPTFSLSHLTAHLSGTTIYFGSSVPAKYWLQCVKHIAGRGPFETGCVLAWAQW